MTCSDDRAYRFSTPAHWRAGAHDLTEIGGPTGSRTGLEPPTNRCLRMIGGGPRGGERPPGGALPSVDRCGRLNWLDPATRRWFRRYDFGVQGLGRLVEPVPGRHEVLDLVIDRAVVWLLTGSGIERHDAHDLRPLGPIAAGPGETVAAIGTDHADGLWVVRTAGRRSLLDRLDRWGRRCHAPIRLPRVAGRPRAVVAAADNRSVFVLCGGRTEPGQPASGGRPPTLLVVTPADGTVTRIELPVGDHVPVALIPLMGGPDAGDAPAGATVVLVSRTDTELVIEAFDAEGRLLARERLDLPPELGWVTGIEGGVGAGLLVTGTGGVAEVVPCPPDDSRSFTFITPTLLAPLGGKGWNRAELTALIPDGAAIEIDRFTLTDGSDDKERLQNIEAVFADPDGTPLTRLTALKDLIPWPADADGPGRCAVLDGPSGDGPVTRPVLIPPGAGPYLWLRIRVAAPAGRELPTLLGLDVRYGNDSYIDHLPAIYREDPVAEADLRQVLAPFETVFDQLDAAIAALPSRIDPATAPDEWTDYLLSWLGLPNLGDLAPDRRRALLEATPELLAGRGTIGALVTALDTVVGGDDAGGGRVTVTDRATEPLAWFLPKSASDGVPPARLGVGTVARAQQPAPFRAGAVTLGRIPLGRGCPDPGEVLATEARLVIIRIEADPELAEALKPIVGRLLAYFVPAHCRVEVTYTGTDRPTRSPRLDTDFRLADEADGEGSGRAASADGRLYGDGHWRLGTTVRLGAWLLPDPADTPLILGRPNSVRHFPHLT